jgi:dipeptidase
MCDTLALRHGGVVWFAKNSDREPDEAQLVVRISEARNDTAQKLRTTCLEIDQTAYRHGIILSKPFWIWGAEMGVNDRGVAIGNEAVFTRVMEKKPGLIGMDLLRLALERGDTAAHALDVIAGLLEKHGQGGVCGYRAKSFRYDNSFLIADPDEMWVLETAGRHWAARKIDTQYAISNRLTLGSEFDLSSDGLIDFAIQRKLFSGKGDFHFAKAFDTWLVPHFARSRERIDSNLDFCAAIARNRQNILLAMLNNLRSHRHDESNPRNGHNSDVCMHAAGPLIRKSQTCGSMVSKLEGTHPLHLFTGTSAPCLSIFKPVDFNEDNDYGVLNADGKTVKDSLWQRHESVHRRLLFLKEERADVKKRIAATEGKMVELLFDKNNHLMPENMHDADTLAADLDESLIREFQKRPVPYPALGLYGLFWKRVNKRDEYFEKDSTSP